MLPSPWKRPFGIDKLIETLRAERQRRLPHFSLENHERLGETYAQYAGGQFTILTRDARNVASLLSAQFSKFGHGQLRSICFGPLLGDGIFTADGSAWKASRRVLAAGLRRPGYPPPDVLESHFQDLRRAITDKLTKTDVVNLRTVLHDYTLDTTTELFLGQSTNILGRSPEACDEGMRFSNAFNEAGRWLATRERFKWFAWLVTAPVFTRSCATARDSLENLIIASQRRERELRPPRSAFTDFVAKWTDLAKARDELMNLLFASRDSNAGLLSWLLYALAREPRVLNNVRREVLSVLGDDCETAPQESDLKRMQYLDDVIRETLRLFPIVPINGRICREATTLPAGGGASGEEPVFVPKGTLVCFSTYACQRSTKYYGSDAMAFRPERWREVSAATRTADFTFHPFLGGPRRCLGGTYSSRSVVYLSGWLIRWQSVSR